ncbi:recombinase family protein [Novosphingobium jiangmenense]|uniref:Recombinase family protein n=1 Tax=Novosphingobium jiangmenense TaxID=2791981 RepID=A0ABS0HG59_9SPHN|nr:recombinase family protein [Novosphingobium jiangmenense]MBF9151252.1 recombinase family protein [Novosphingobium jiangmenense]
MAKVYSYSRFSTPEQSKGDSYRRQTEAARAFADRHGLELDEALTFHDEGVSAFKGGNLAPGAALAQFRERVREGLIEPGSILLIESLDRLSRMEPLDAMAELTDLLRSGVNVATLTDGRVYSRETLRQDNGLGLMVALMVAVRAHEESAIKGRRVAAAWNEKRRKVRAGEAERLTRKAPAWLVADGSGWQVDEDRAAIVRRVYSLTLSGEGEHKIAERFNREGVPPLGRGRIWHRSSVAKLLRNRAVIGELTPGHIEHREGRKVRVEEEPIAGAFPAIIEQETWLAVRALKDGETGAARGLAGSRPIANILAGLARCPLCGGAMTRVYKGSVAKAGVARLVCTRAKAGAGCSYQSVRLPDVEGAILSHPELALKDIPAGKAGQDLDREALSLESNIAGTVAHMTDLAEALEAHPSKAGAARLAKLEAELGTLQAALEAVEERRTMTDQGLIRARAERLFDALEAASGEASPDKGLVNAAMRVLFSGVTVDYRTGELRFHWKQGGETALAYGRAFP